MLDIKNKKAQDIIDAINKHEKDKEEILKNCNGAVYLEILVPDVKKEDFEKWQLGEPMKNMGYSFLAQNCTGATMTVFLNNLERICDKYKKDNPMAMIGNMISMMKNNMVIKEEDLDDES